MSFMYKKVKELEDEILRLERVNRQLVAYVEGPVVVCGDDEILARKAAKVAALDAAKGSK